MGAAAESCLAVLPLALWGQGLWLPFAVQRKTCASALAMVGT